MNHNEYPNDTSLIWELRDSLSELAAPERPPLAAITSRGRAHQRRRLAAFAGLGGASVAACTALALGLTGTLGTSAPGASTGASGTAAAARGTNASGGTGTVQTSAFILTSNANGTDTLTLTMSQVFDPVVFQQALAQHGIPALVKTGIYCTSNPAPFNPSTIGVLSVQPPFKLDKGRGMAPAASGVKPNNQLIADTKTVINPAAIPAGTELFFGYSSTGHALFFDLIYTHSYTCASGQPPAT
jgi:hypothetical protein